MASERIREALSSSTQRPFNRDKDVYEEDNSPLTLRESLQGNRYLRIFVYVCTLKQID